MTMPSVEPFVTEVPGTVFRYYRGEEDIPAIRAVHSGCREADRVDPYSVCYRVPNMGAADYAKDVALSLGDGSGRNILLAEADGRVVGHCRLEWWDEWDGERQAEKVAYLSRGWVLPEWRGRGIGTALLRWAEARSQELHRERGDLPGEFATNASDGEQDSIRLLTEAGYRLRFLSPELAYDDFSRLPPRTVPEGFELRPMEPEHHREIARAIIEANVDANFTPEQLADWIEREEDRMTEMVAGCDPTISWIGWQDGQVAGLHVCRRIGEIGDVANVATRPAYRMRGLARSLMFHCLHSMREQGLRGARLYTGIGTERDARPEGPYKMYQGFGFRLLAFHNRYRKPMPLAQ